MHVTRHLTSQGHSSLHSPSPDWYCSGSNHAVTSQGVEMVRVVMHAMQAAKDPAWGYVPAEGEAKRVQNISCCFCIDRPRRCMNFIERWMIRCCIGYRRRIFRFLECLRGQSGGKEREKMTDVRKVGYGARGEREGALRIT